MLDSDAAPQPGWLENLLKPFADPKIKVVGGFTVLGAQRFAVQDHGARSGCSTLPEEREKTVRRQKIHANNCAVRTDFFRDHPFPDLPAFKKQCVFWLRDLVARGLRLHPHRRRDDVHAPHPGSEFLLWRAWTERDRTAISSAIWTSHPIAARPPRLRLQIFCPKKTAQLVARSFVRAGQVGLPGWKRPARDAGRAGLLPGALAAGGSGSVVTRDFAAAAGRLYPQGRRRMLCPERSARARNKPTPASASWRKRSQPSSSASARRRARRRRAGGASSVGKNGGRGHARSRGGTSAFVIIFGMAAVKGEGRRHEIAQVAGNRVSARSS